MTMFKRVFCSSLIVATLSFQGPFALASKITSTESPTVLNTEEVDAEKARTNAYKFRSFIGLSTFAAFAIGMCVAFGPCSALLADVEGI